MDEKEILKFWKENKIFEKTLEKKSPKGEFIFTTDLLLPPACLITEACWPQSPKTFFAAIKLCEVIMSAGAGVGIATACP